MTQDLVVLRPEGLYCPPGDFFIDPWRPVARAVLTHAHADHARRGHGACLASADSVPVLRARLGDVAVQGLRWGEAVHLNGVRVSLHPAGHVTGSAQVRIEQAGQVWVASGDYFASAFDDERNPTCPPFEPVRCHCFITESTFGLPLYRWPRQREVLAQIDAWWQANAAAGRPSLLLAYSFGKAQHLLAGVDAGIGPLLVHDSVAAMNRACRAAGVVLPDAQPLSDLPPGRLPRDALVVAPPTATAGPWAGRLAGCSAAFASGWMQLRAARRRQAPQRGFVLSDHADWPGLHRAIAATGAERVIVTHGFEAPLVHALRQRGLQAGSFATASGGAAVPGDDPGAPLPL